MILKILKNKKNELLFIYCAAFLMFQIGLIAQIVGKNSLEYTEYSTLFMMCMPVGINFFLAPASMVHDFNLGIGMSRTRKSFLIASIFAEFVKYISIVLLGYISHNIQSNIYSNLKEEIPFSNFFQWDIMISVIVIATSLSLFISTMFLKFGKKAFWIVWVIYMIICLLPSRIESAMNKNKNSVLGKLGKFIVKSIDNIHKEQIMVAGAGLTIFFLIITTLVLLNADINS